jgi:ribose-phosphate pyrophosphokinase
VDGRDAIIVDDLISSGTTLIRAAHTCSEHGAARVMAAATHGLFMADAATALAAPVLQSVVIADTVPPARVPPGALRDKLTMLRSAPLFADVIQRLHEGGSLLELMES